MISLIVAAAENMAIGRKGGIPWHISEDFKYFKSVTMGHPVIMGYGTWASMGCKPLPGRRNIVLSSRYALLNADGEAGAEFLPSIEAAIEATKGEDEVFFIGGGSVYRQALPYADKVYLTEIHTIIEDADTFFPALDPALWKEISRSGLKTDEKSGLDFEFIVYRS